MSFDTSRMVLASSAAALLLATMILVWRRLRPLLQLVWEIVQPPFSASVSFEVTKDSVVLITGATCPKGMGIHLVRAYHKRVRDFAFGQRKRIIIVGYESFNEVLSPLCESDRDIFRHPSTLYLQIDLADATCGRQLSENLNRHSIKTIDVVIQLAAVGWVGNSFTQKEQSVRRIVNVNLRAPILVTRAVLPFLGVKRSKHGGKTEKKLVFVSSVKSQAMTPFFSVYTATKAAIDQLAISLRGEFHDSNVQVQLIHPGATRTNFFKNAGVPDGAFDVSSFATSSQMGENILACIDRPRSFRTVFGSNQEKWQFVLEWLLPQWISRVWHAATLRRWRRVFKRPQMKTGNDGILRAVVTGGSSGVGQAILRHIEDVQTDFPRVDTLSWSRTTSTKGQSIDLSSNELMDNARRLLSSGFGDKPVDLLVNNAGVNFSGRIALISEDEIEKTIRVNVIAPVVLTNACTEHNRMLGMPPPSLCFVASMSCYFSYPGSVSYAASKDALASFAKTLGNALIDSVVLTCYLGPTDTLQAKTNAPSLNAEDEAKRASQRMAPEVAASHIWDSLLRGDAQMVPGNALVALARKAALDPSWAEAMMRVTQYHPMVEKHMVERGTAGI